MATLNVAGLLAYQFFRRITDDREFLPVSRTTWVIDEQKLRLWLPIGLLVTAGAQIAVYLQFGGVMEFMRAATDRSLTDVSLAGMGSTFLVAESFPMLVAIGWLYYARKNGWLQSWTSILFFIGFMFALILLFGGLRGSRSNSIWPLFTVLVAVHYWIRPVPRKLLLAGLCFVVAFMYFYGFVKGAGPDGVAAIFSAEQRVALEEQTGRTLESALLGDLSRASIQAMLLYRLTDEQSDYEYSFGRTYAGAAFILVPRQLVPEQPVNKVREGTNALYGMGAYVPGERVSTRIYGLAGETMLNFGVWAVPVAFAVFGLVVGYIRRFVRSLDPQDARLLFIGVLINLAFLLLTADSDNVVFFLIKRAIIPFSILWLMVAFARKRG
jgi:hypothetical protein